MAPKKNETTPAATGNGSEGGSTQTTYIFICRILLDGVQRNAFKWSPAVNKGKVAEALFKARDEWAPFGLKIDKRTVTTEPTLMFEMKDESGSFVQQFRWVTDTRRGGYCTGCGVSTASDTKTPGCPVCAARQVEVASTTTIDLNSLIDSL